MKKIVALVLVLFSFASITFAQADEYATIHEAFKEHTLDDLLLLQKMVEIELEYRGYYSKETVAKEFDVPVGKYIIGVDIPAGVYTVTHGGGMFSAIIVIGNYEAFYPVSQDSPVGKIELTEGQTLEVQMSGVKFSEYKGLGF